MELRVQQIQIAYQPRIFIVTQQPHQVLVHAILGFYGIAYQLLAHVYHQKLLLVLEHRPYAVFEYF